MDIFKIILILFLSASSLIDASAQDIYITLDISGSMWNSRYIYGNYAGQTLSLLNHSKKTTFIIGTDPIEINDLNILRKGVGGWGNGNGWPSEILDIETLNKIIDLNKENTIFIIGDGDWNRGSNYTNTFSEFRKILRNPKSKIYFLETAGVRNYKSDFGTDLKNDGISKIFKTHNDKTLLENINVISEEITGVSAIPPSEIKSNGSCYRFSRSLDISGLSILYQDFKTPANLPQIQSFKANNREINYKHIGNPTTQGLGIDQIKLSGSVYESHERINGGQEIEICFDSKIDVKNLKIYPFLEITPTYGLDVEVGLAQSSQTESETEIICMENDRVTVNYELKQANGTALPNEILKKIQAVLIADDQNYKGKLVNGKFQFNLPMSSDKITYTIEAEIPGYKKLNSNRKSIIRSSDCDQSNMFESEPYINSLINFGTFSFNQFKENYCLNLRLVDSETGQYLNPDYFDITINHKYNYIFKDIHLTKTGETDFNLCFEPREICVECLIPNKINLEIEAKPKNNQVINGKIYQIIKSPVTLKIEHENNWILRCKCLLILLLILGIFLWYFRLLINKDRFRRKSSIKQEQNDHYSFDTPPIKNFYALRKKGFAAWFNRWFIPFPGERNTKSFTVKSKNISFVAHKNTKKVSMLSSVFKDKEVSSISFDEESEDKYFHLDDSIPINIEFYLNGVKYEYDLSYYYDKKSWDDINTLKKTIRILMFLCIIGMAGALYFLIRSLF